MTNSIDLEGWVSNSKDDSEEEFRKAVKCLLEGISKEASLASLMVMKGGLLLSIKYNSPRYTKDIDFSTQKPLADLDFEELLQSFQKGIEGAEENEYGLVFRLQKHEVKPAPKNNPSFPSLHLKIGYANRSHVNSYNQLKRNQSPKIVAIDFSFNEWIKDDDAETVEIDNAGTLKLYSFYEILAEKIRSLLQQPIRRRERYQDVYDVHRLLSESPPSEEKCLEVLNHLRAACKARDVPLSQLSFDDPAIKDLARKGYEEQLRDQLPEEPPEFEEAFAVVEAFFKSLPWDEENAVQEAKE